MLEFESKSFSSARMLLVRIV